MAAALALSMGGAPKQDEDVEMTEDEEMARALEMSMQGDAAAQVFGKVCTHITRWIRTFSTT